MGGDKLRYGFETLEVYQHARQFRIKMYSVAGKLPSEEKFSLVPQIRRAALSLTNNIAEGHGRFHYKENIHFLHQARGSLQELIDDLNVCHDEKYQVKESIDALKNDAYALLQKINGYISYLRYEASDEGK